MLCTALSSSTMMPLRDPRLSAMPCPRYLSPASVASQISATVFALPTSSTVIMFEGCLPLVPIIRVLIKQLLAISFWPLACLLLQALWLCPSLASETHNHKNRCPVIYPTTKLPHLLNSLPLRSLRLLRWILLRFCYFRLRFCAYWFQRRLFPTSVIHVHKW